jgi:hypothetical protein
LLAKVWLADPAANTYGGVYLWRDTAAMESYLRSELLQSVMSSPQLVNITSSDYAVDEDLTRVTQPGLRILADAAVAGHPA